MGGKMNKKSRPNFKPKFRLEVAELIVKQGYSVREATKAMNVSKSTVGTATQR